MIDKGEGDRLQKQQQRENLREVIQYCENKVDCRRQMVLQYFGEKFDKSECNRTCDNCERTTRVSMVDRTDYALKALELSQEITDKHTLNILLDIFRGSSGKRSLNYQNCTYYGSGKDLSRIEAERILQSMVTNQVFRTHSETNAGGFTTSYLKLGNKWKDLKNGKLKITLTVCDEDVNEVPPKDRVYTTKKESAKKRQIKIVESEQEEEFLNEDVGFFEDYDFDQDQDQDISLYQDEENDDSSEAEIYEEAFDLKSSDYPSSPVYNTTSSTTNYSHNSETVSLSNLDPEYQSIISRGNGGNNKFSNSSNKNATNNTDTKNLTHSNNTNTPVNSISRAIAPGHCYDNLIQWRDAIAQSKKLNTAFVISNGLLGQIARKLPGNRSELGEIPGMTADKVEKYGQDIIDITRRFIL